MRPTKLDDAAITKELANLPGWTHAGNQGWGPWEVNLGRVMNRGGAEWRNLLLGRAVPPALGRYGPDEFLAVAPASSARALEHAITRVRARLDGDVHRVRIARRDSLCTWSCATSPRWTS